MMNRMEKVVLAALVHDLPALMKGHGVKVPAPAEAVLRLGEPAEPGLASILKQAEAYAIGAVSPPPLVTDRPLVSIFSRVALNHQAPLCYQPVAELPATAAAGEAIGRLFPSPEPDGSGMKAQVEKLAAGLSWLASEVGLDNFERSYPHLLTLLQRYGWCLPSHSQEVSLFDHAKLTSAIGAALYRYHQDELRPEAIEAAEDEARFGLVVGDLSGIQEYIFGITSIGAGGGVAKRLRARSFYLSVLGEVVSHQVAFRLGVPLGNVLMSSGGKFYVLAASRGNVDQEMQALRREIDGWFRREFNGEIAVNLAQIGLAGAEFRAGDGTGGGFGAVVTALSLRLNREKQQAGRGMLVGESGWNEHSFVIRERDFGGAGACVSCGKFPGDLAESLCKRCTQDKEMGQKVPRMQYVAYYQGPGGEIALPLGASARVVAAHELGRVGQPYLVTKLNDPDIRELAGQPGWFRYVANYIPVKKNQNQEPLTFEDIAKGATEKREDRVRGRALLGYVKADVDYLGILFAQGLRRDTVY